MKAILIDDEPLALDYLEHNVGHCFPNSGLFLRTRLFRKGNHRLFGNNDGETRYSIYLKKLRKVQEQ